MKKTEPPSSPPLAYVPSADCEFHGQGGSYVLDLKTGKRTRVEDATAPAPQEEKAK